MAATGFTPIILYHSTTASAVPTAVNLNNGELALNLTDGRLYYKDNSGTVKLIGANILPAANGGTGQDQYAGGDILYATGTTTLSKLPIGTTGRYLSSTGTAPQWSAPAALTKTDDTNVTLTLGGSASTALLNAASLTLGWTGTLAVSRGGTGTGTAFTTGSIIFAGASGVYSQSNADIFWDNTNKRLGVGTNAPNEKVRIVGTSGNAQFGAGTSGNAFFINVFDSASAYMTVSVTNSTDVGVGAASNIPFFLMSNNTNRMYIEAGGDVQAGADNTQNFGTAAKRWKQFFAGTTVISTSDVNTKTDIESLSQQEKNVAQAIKGLIKRYKFKDAVAEKGNGARIHVGVIAQEVQAAFEAEGLNAANYGLFCSDTWWEKEVQKPDSNGQMQTRIETFKEATEGATEKTRLGIRYDELLAFVIAAL